MLSERRGGVVESPEMGGRVAVVPAIRTSAESTPRRRSMRALRPAEREHYAEALTQEGLSGEVAVLRLHLLRLVERDDEARPGEIPRTVHALIRALQGQVGKDGAAGDADAALDAAVRAEGLRLLGERSPDAS